VTRAYPGIRACVIDHICVVYTHRLTEIIKFITERNLDRQETIPEIFDGLGFSGGLDDQFIGYYVSILFGDCQNILQSVHKIIDTINTNDPFGVVAKIIQEIFFSQKFGHERYPESITESDGYSRSYDVV
jgi:hypothetical protein